VRCKAELLPEAGYGRSACNDAVERWVLLEHGVMWMLSYCGLRFLVFISTLPWSMAAGDKTPSRDGAQARRGGEMGGRGGVEVEVDEERFDNTLWHHGL